jgi:hypothetical protein
MSEAKKLNGELNQMGEIQWKMKFLKKWKRMDANK